RSRLRQRLLEVRPEHVHVLEPDAQAEQILWNAVALPAATALQYRVDAAKAGRVGDLLQRRFDLSRVPADIEREHAAEAGIANLVDRRVSPQSLDPKAQRLQAA